jgi:hypothetical protein
MTLLLHGPRREYPFVSAPFLRIMNILSSKGICHYLATAVSDGLTFLSLILFIAKERVIIAIGSCK